MTKTEFDSNRPEEHTEPGLKEIREHDIQIGIDIDRIKQDIAETASRHGFDTLSFSIEWKEGVHLNNALPDVEVGGTRTVLTEA
jgi:hypothetical protein